MTASPEVPHDTALAGWRVVPDASLRHYAEGRVVLGGSPTRLLRLGEHGAALLARWCAGEPIGAAPQDTALARRVLHIGLVHPSPRPGRLTAADVTVVVPVKDNPTGLARLRAATGDLATIVVDDGSAAPLLGATIRHRAPAGPAATRNTGWRHADTALVAFLDSDTIPESGWLDPILGLFDDPDVAAVAPRVRGLPGDGPIARYETDRSALDMGSVPAAVRPMTRVGYVPTAALVARRDALAALGGFDETLRFGEDVDLVWRLIAAGHTVRYQPEATVWHQPRPTLRGWLRQRHDYGTSAAPLSTRHPRLLPCARANRWTLAAAALSATGRPGLGLAVAAASTAPLLRTLRRKGLPAWDALTLTGQGQLSAAGMLAAAVRRGWWPLLLPSRRGRGLLAASLLPCLVEAATGHKGLRWLTLRLADDLAYSTGVITGCVRHRTATPLLPQATDRQS